MFLKLLDRLIARLRHRDLEREVDAELAFHLEMQTQANLDRGMAPDQARREAKLALGGLDQTKEAVRDTRWTWFDSTWREGTYACRRLRRAPVLTLTTVATLALGIGATTTIFGHVNSVLFKTVAVPAGDRVVAVVETMDGRPDYSGLMEKHRRALCERTLSTVDIASVFSLDTVLTAPDDTHIVSVEFVSGNYFALLGVHPLAGRLLLPSDDIVAADAYPIVISEHLWRTSFGSDPGIVGRAVKAGRGQFVVVGVVPSSFGGIFFATVLGHDVWAPRAAVTAMGRHLFDQTLCIVAARLKPGISLQQADAEVRAVSRGLDPRDAHIGAALRPFSAGIAALGQFVGLGLGVLALSVVVFSIACINLVNVQMAGVIRRADEIAIRVANGATHRDIARLLFIEAFILSLLGGAAGVATAWLVTRAFGAIPLPQLGNSVLRYNAAPDAHVLVYGCLATLIAAAAVGFASSRQVSQVAPLRELAVGGTTVGGPSRGSRIQPVLVGAQIAGSIVLLVAAGLFIRTSLAGVVIRPGFDVDHTALGHFHLGLTDGHVTLDPTPDDESRGRAGLAQALRAASQTPGVRSASLATGLPTGQGGDVSAVAPEAGAGDASRRVLCRFLSVSPGFFNTIGVRIRMGRDFDTRDVKTGVSVAIINEDLAATMWPGQNPVGQRLQTREGRRSGPWLEVVAVVGNTATASSNAEDRRFVFVPLEQEYRDQVLLVVRGSGPGSAVAQTVRLSLSSTLPDVPLFDVRSMRDEIAVETRAFRVAAIGLSMLGVLALLLALVGLYGVMAYGVGQRTREFGVRQALGATAVDLYRLAAGEGLQMLAKGAVVGSLVALTLPWAIPFFLVGVRPLFDWVVVLAVPPALVLVGVLACLIPVRRAARLTPTVALRDL